MEDLPPIGYNSCNSTSIDTINQSDDAASSRIVSNDFSLSPVLLGGSIFTDNSNGFFSLHSNEMDDTSSPTFTPNSGDSATNGNIFDGLSSIYLSSPVLLSNSIPPIDNSNDCGDYLPDIYVENSDYLPNIYVENSNSDNSEELNSENNICDDRGILLLDDNTNTISASV